MKSIHKVLLAFLMVCASGMASADGFYLGAGAYTTEVDDAINGVAVDDEDTILAAFVGWRPIELLGVEAGYYDLGQYDVGVNHLDAQAYTLAGVLTLDIGPVGVYGKAGAAYLDLEINGTGYDERDTEPFAALGAYVDVMDMVYVYAEYMQVQAEVDVDMIGVGVRLDLF